MKTCFILAWN